MTPFSPKNIIEYRRLCIEFVQAVKEAYPEMLAKQKIHLFLHLADNMADFGPSSAFNTERYSKVNMQFSFMIL